MPNKYYIELEMSRYAVQRIILDEDPYTGKVQKGVFFPFEDNEFISHSNSGRVRFHFVAEPFTCTTNGTSHVIRKYLIGANMRKMFNAGFVKENRIGTMHPAK